MERLIIDRITKIPQAESGLPFKLAFGKGKVRTHTHPPFPPNPSCEARIFEMSSDLNGAIKLIEHNTNTTTNTNINQPIHK